MFSKFILLVLLFLSFTSCKSRTTPDSKLRQFPSGEMDQDHPCSIAHYSESFGERASTPTQDQTRLLDKNQWSIIRSTAMLSRLAYKDRGTIRNTAADWGYRTTDVTEEGSMQAFIVSNASCVALVFRGTDATSLRDWMVDAAAGKKSVPGGKMHSGFYKAFNSVKDRLRRQLKAHDVEAKTFWVTGHSLGGALAGVFAHWNKFENDHKYNVDRIVTFGQPLFADELLANLLRQDLFRRYLRVVNNKDIVARVPHWFTHFGDLFWIKPNGSVFLSEQMAFGSGSEDNSPTVAPVDIPEDLKPTKEALDEFLRDAKQHHNDNPPSGSVVYGGLQMTDDHSMDLYLDLVTQNWKRR